jgi:large subunit ribosomal protein L2
MQGETCKARPRRAAPVGPPAPGAAGEQRLIHLSCKATIGAVSNPLRRLRVLGKAGHKRHLGIRPTVLGVSMNAVDHPHGGRTKGGRHSCSPWGLLSKGKRTRKKRKFSTRFILVTRQAAKKR